MKVVFVSGVPSLMIADPVVEVSDGKATVTGLEAIYDKKGNVSKTDSPVTVTCCERLVVVVELLDIAPK